MALFEAHHLHKRFGDQVVLEEINFAFEAGQLSGIMGPNGAGKTTCFNVLTGRYKPDRGHIIFEGRDITGQSPRRIARMGVSRSFQIINVFDEYTAMENIVLAVPEVQASGFRLLQDLSRDSASIDKAAAVLRRVGLDGKEAQLASTLSYGDRRALEIGIALASEPKILFLDEPTAGFDIEAMARLGDVIRRIKENTTIVMVEHDMRFLFNLADVISVIHWGQVIAAGTPAALRENPWVQASNLGRLA